MAAAPSPLVAGALDEEAEEMAAVDGSPLVNALIVAADYTRDPVTVLGRFCNEGNNVGDGIDLAMLVFNACSVVSPIVSARDLKFPLSWSTLFGPPLADDSTLF
jgi:hypothetical protein